jgi:hypothetical protein
MNYTRIYNAIISRAKMRPVLEGYAERHHIIPRSLGGTDDLDNLVMLTAKEHFICHLLLAKMYEKNSVEWQKMTKALMMMRASGNAHDRYTSATYEYFKEAFSEAQSYAQRGSRNSSYGTRWIHSLEFKQSKKICKKAPLPDGWNEGRIIDFEKHASAMMKKKLLEDQQAEWVARLGIILEYYRDNDISIRALSKKFNVNGNIYKQFEKYYPEEYRDIVMDKPRNSNKGKGRYMPA